MFLFFGFVISLLFMDDSIRLVLEWGWSFWNNYDFLCRVFFWLVGDDMLSILIIVKFEVLIFVCC